MKTAVEWLYERLERMIPRTALYNIDKEDYFNQAKKMEKQQIIDAYNTSFLLRDKPYATADKYYNETFKSE